MQLRIKLPRQRTGLLAAPDESDGGGHPSLTADPPCRKCPRVARAERRVAVWLGPLGELDFRG